MANFKDIMAMCLTGASYAAISAALECSNRDIAKVKAVIADHAITQSSFAQLDPEFFDTHFSDQRTSRRLRYDRPDFEKLAKCQRSLKSSPKRSSKSSPSEKDWMGDFFGPMGTNSLLAWAGTLDS